ncbi:MAG: sugar phosphate isomerase/epimerase family protein [Oscillospiraceae bacterium]
MLLIQPESARLAEYDALGLSYELIEQSMPGTLDAPLPDCWRNRDIRVVHGVFVDINPASNDPQIRAVCQARCRQSCEIAKTVGAKAVVLHTGFFPYLPGDAYGEGWADASAEFYQSLIEDYDLNIHVENCADRNPDLLRKLMERRGSQRLKVCLDVGHIHYTDTPDAVWFEALGPYIGQLHFSDNMGLLDDHLPLGEGSCDFSRLSALCAALCPAPEYTTLEVGGPENIARSVKFLREHHYFPFER